MKIDDSPGIESARENAGARIRRFGLLEMKFCSLRLLSSNPCLSIHLEALKRQQSAHRAKPIMEAPTTGRNQREDFAIRQTERAPPQQFPSSTFARNPTEWSVPATPPTPSVGRRSPTKATPASKGDDFAGQAATPHAEENATTASPRSPGNKARSAGKTSIGDRFRTASAEHNTARQARRGAGQRRPALPFALRTGAKPPQEEAVLKRPGYWALVWIDGRFANSKACVACLRSTSF